MINVNSSTTLKKLKVELDYSGKTMGIEFEPYKTIAQLKDKARKLFFIVNSETKLFHTNKDLTPYESINLGEYFKNKSKIYLKLVLISNGNNLKDSNLPNKNDKNSNFNDLKSNYIEKDNTLGLINDENNNTNLITLNNSNMGIEANDNYINNRSSNVNKSPNQRAKSNLKARDNSDSNSINPAKNFCECNSKMVKSYYCRDDNSFICKICRMEEKHKTHHALHIDFNNLEESIKLYAITLQADISLDRKASRGYFQNFQSQKFVEPSSRKEMIIRKLDEIERKQEEILQKLPKFDPQNIDNILNEFDRKSANTNEELEEILSEMHSNYTKKKTKITMDNCVEYFSKINSREKDLEVLTNDLKNYKINFRVHKKIDELYKILENALDDVLNNQTFSIENFSSNKYKSSNNSMMNNSNDYANLFNESFLSVDMINSMKNNLKVSKDKDLNSSLINNNKNIDNSVKIKDHKNLYGAGNKNIKLNKINLKNKSVANLNSKINVEAIDKINGEMNEKKNNE